MGKQVPIGKKESLCLEFKSSEALRNPFSISREVVGMLNANGGEVWIGLKEANGIAVEMEELKDIEKKREALLNHLLEVIEPRLLSSDLGVESLSSDGKSALIVRVAKVRDRGPFAQMKDGGRHFLVRVDHRIRPMTREEVFGPRALDPVASTRLVELRDKALSRGRSGLWLGVQPVPAVQVDMQGRDLRLLLTDPTKSGNRESGWNFRYPAVLGVEPRLEKGSLSFGTEGDRRTTVWKDGFVEFWVSMDGLRHRTDLKKEIYPLAVLEYSVSVMRLAKAIHVQVANAQPSEVVIDLALLRAEGWQLPAFPPGTYGYDFRHGSPSELDGGQFLQEPLRLPWQEFEEHPDRAAFLLVRSLYEAFHQPEDRIPKEYDRRTHRLMIGD